MNRILVAIMFLLPGGRISAGDYLVIYKQHVSENSTPSVMECDALVVYPGYSKLITKGKPTFEVKVGALIATLTKKEFLKLDEYSRQFPSLKKTLDAVKSRWQAEAEELSRRKLDAEKNFSESVAAGSRIQTLDGHEYFGVIKNSGDYGLTITTTDGVSSVGTAQLCTVDLKKWNSRDRGHDGRFWYERTLAIIKARESGADVTAESVEAEAHFPESSRYLAQMDKARNQRRLLMSGKIAATKTGEADQGNPLKTQDDIDELVRMSKLGYNPVLDETTGQVFYSAPLEREQELRDALKGY